VGLHSGQVEELEHVDRSTGRLPMRVFAICSGAETDDR
jgi:hypothetical protein